MKWLFKFILRIKMEISKFQEHIKKIYFENDSKRGREKTFIWLVEEIGELAEEIRKSNKKNDAMGEEFADVFAWLCSEANLYGIDIERCVMKKYGKGCPKCMKNPCECKL